MNLNTLMAYSALRAEAGAFVFRWLFILAIPTALVYGIYRLVLANL